MALLKTVSSARQICRLGRFAVCLSSTSSSGVSELNPNTLYTEQHEELKRSLYKIIENDINPYVDQWEAEGQFPAHEVFKKFGQGGFLGVNKPTEYGGLGLDYSYSIAVAEELGKINCAGIPIATGVMTDMATPALARFGSDKLKKEFLAPTIAGDYVCSIAVSEPSAGSDVAGIRTRAEKKGDDYIINGSKMWITNAYQADWLCLLANTGEGPIHQNKSLIIVPSNTPGIQLARKIKKLGMWCSDTAEIYFEDVRVPQSHLIGEEGRGFVYQMTQFQEERLFGAASGIEALFKVIRLTTEYASQRMIYGKPLISNQVIHFRLAELETEVEALRSLVYRTVAVPGTSDKGGTVNPLEILMNTAKSSTSLPQLKATNTRKDVLFNDIVKILGKTGAGFQAAYADSSGKVFCEYLCQAVWYMDPHWPTLQKRVRQPPFLRELYARKTEEEATESCYTYNDFQRKKKQKPTLSVKELENLCHMGHEYLCTVWMGQPGWSEAMVMLQDMIHCIEGYCKYLKAKSEDMAMLRGKLSPARNPIEDGICHTVETTVSATLPCFADLELAVMDSDPYTPMLLNDMHLMKGLTPVQKMQLSSKLLTSGLRVPFVLFKYSPFGGISTYLFVWKLPPASERDDISDSKYASLTKKIGDDIPVYHTRAMKAEFRQHYENLVSASPALFRSMYQFLTGDHSVSENTIQKEVDVRVKLALSGDRDIAIDLRELNQGRPEKHDAFWDELQHVLDEDFPTAADDRRHSNHVFLPIAISVRDLIDRVKARLPEGTPVPSESWVRLQFQPKNSRYHSAANYTGRFDVTYKVQSRSTHADHPDAYYCMALFKYLREFAVLNREDCIFLCEDDKHAINIGEPGCPLASLDRGRKVMVQKGQRSVASDHDWHRFKFVVSVLLKSAIPLSTVDSGFYEGNVHVTIKDAIFQTSTPLHHTAEKEDALTQPDEVWKPIECCYSDGGPDHNVRHGSVKVAHICHFLKKDLDMLVAAITYPGGSYMDPAERMMPLINIALNGVALSREAMTEEMEKTLKGCSSMDDIRCKASKDPGIKDAVEASIQPLKQMVEGRIQRMKLKDEPLTTQQPATNDQIEGLFSFIHSIDRTMEPTFTTKKDLAKCKELEAYLSSHSRERHYCFQLKKCTEAPCSDSHREKARQKIECLLAESEPEIRDALLDATESAQTWTYLRAVVKAAEDGLALASIQELRDSQACRWCQPPRLAMDKFASLSWLPDPLPKDDVPEKYQHFADLFGKDTPEKRPSAPKVSEDQFTKYLLVKEKVRSSIACVDCFKPRCLYSDKKSFDRNEDTISIHCEAVLYTCGSTLFPEGHSLAEKVVVRRAVTCEDHVEWQYYSSGKLLPACCWCGDDEVEPIPDDIAAQFSTVLPRCIGCTISRDVVAMGPKRKTSQTGRTSKKK